MLAEEIFTSSNHWLDRAGDPVALLNETFEGLTQTCYRHGPFLRAVSDAAAADERFEKDWVQFLCAFDDAGVTRIEADQAAGVDRSFRCSARRLFAQSTQCVHVYRCVRAAPKEQAETDPGCVGSDLDIHTLWSQVARRARHRVWFENELRAEVTMAQQYVFVGSARKTML